MNFFLKKLLIIVKLQINIIWYKDNNVELLLLFLHFDIII